MTSIALVDNDQRILTNLAIVLRKEGFTVTTYNDSASAFAAFSKELPDLIILEVVLRGIDGLDLLKKVKYLGTVHTIFFTRKSDELDEVFGLEMGADDYISKSASHSVLIARTKTVLRRTMNDTEHTSARGCPAIIKSGLVIDPLRHAVQWKGKDVSLGVKEFRLLQTLAERPGVIKSRDQLMDVLYRDQAHVDERTIDAYIGRLRKAMHSVDKTFSAIKTLYGLGYCYKED